MKKTKYQKQINYAWLGLVAFCLLIYGYDLALGDGDGVIERLGLNPLSIALASTLLFLLLRGLLSSRKLIINLSLGVLSTLCALLIIEKVLPYIATYQAGVHSSIQRVDNVFPYTSLDSIYFKNYRPNCSFRTQLLPIDGGRNILHSINPDGMRGPEVSPKRAGEQRVLLVGDSYIQATQVAYEESIGPILQQMLPDSFSVVQHGFPSWSPLLEWNWTLRKGLDFEPDAVVLFLYTNDFFSGDAVGDSGYMPYAKFNENGEPSGFDFSSLDNTLAGGNRNPWNLMLLGLERLRLVRMTSFLYRKARSQATLAEERLADYLEMPPQDFSIAYEKNNQTKDIFTVALWDFVNLMQDTSLWSAELRDRVELSLGHIKGLQQSLACKNIPLAVCLIPNPWQFAGENNFRKQEVAGWPEFVFPAGGLGQAVELFCATNNLPLLNLYGPTQAAKKGNPDTLLYCPSDPHWTVAGHQMAASILREFLLQKDLIKLSE